ncbi:unnamed protein product [Bursaphelenchus xylophilus]|uniref:(pine wood nematode) hypothetical protein n=1 Tax=Bursaphelenchus xylophilus TaxID=6326 RepID=A0A1I7S1B0_BURXY|nr:unnamed protein product [Bursaphelenchus xylophilus]CAG9080213.1 unnamed protein product [Bursaphelenchus xylophilus]
MKSIFDKLTNTKLPTEFANEVEIIRQHRDNTMEMTKHMKKMVRHAVSLKHSPSSKARKNQQADEFNRLIKECDKSKNMFLEQGYYYILAKTSDLCSVLSKMHHEMEQQQHDQAYMPIKIWMDEEFPLMIKDMKRCQKATKALDSATTANVTAPSVEHSRKREKILEAHTLLFRQCKAELEKHKRTPRHHTLCLQTFVQHEYNFAKRALAEVEKAQAAMKNLCEKKEGERKMQKEQMAKEAAAGTVAEAKP